MEKLFSRIECKTDVKEFVELLQYHQWRHRIPIKDGFVTPGYLEDAYWEMSHFPKSLKGKSFLDIGANDGINAFHAERLGARHVVGIDLYADILEMGHTVGWSERPHKLAKAALGSNVDFRRLSAYDVAELNEQFDYILLADVMNWLTDLPTVLQRVSAICGDTLIIRDGLMRKDSPQALLQYVHSPTYDLMYLPNKTFMETILKQQGFKTVTFHSINTERLFDEWVSHFPLISSKKEVGVYADPWSTEPVKRLTPVMVQALSKIGDRIFLRSHGWVNASDVTAEIFEPRGVFKTVRKVLGNNIVLKLKNVFSKVDEAAYTIIAKR